MSIGSIGDEASILSAMGIEERLGGDPFFQLPRPPRSCTDFLVKEIHGPGLTGGGRQAGSEWPLYRLVKEGIDTITALKLLSDATGLRGWSFSGLKDAQALTIQWITGPREVTRPPDRVCFEGGLALFEGWTRRRINRGSHVANQFLIITRIEADPAKVRKVFPNYFGPQRFGSRPPLTHELGIVLLKEGAEGLYALLREKKRGNGWWEKRFIERYESNPRACENNPRTCLGRIASILVEAVQAFLFNKCLSEIIPQMRVQLYRKPGASMGVLWGRGFQRASEHTGIVRSHAECVSRAAGEIGIKNMKVNASLIPRGGLRPLSVFVESLKTCPGGGLKLLFRLPPGVYASSFLWENAEGILDWFTARCIRTGFWRKYKCHYFTPGGF